MRSHRGGRVGHEILGVDDDRRVPSNPLHSDEELVQQPQSSVEGSHVVLEGKPRSGDLLRSANQEGMAGLGFRGAVT